MNGSVAGFFSYAHADNACEQDRILRLAELIRGEYSLATGHDLALFTDRTGNRWVDEWHDRVRTGLDTSTFFIPVITPRYFSRPECRKELVDFTCRAREHGMAELVLPIVYTHTVALTDPASDDEAVALVRRMRHEKWHELRTDAETSTAHRRAVCRLATRLADVMTRSSLPRNGSGPIGGPRTLDVVGALEEAAPRWRVAFDLMVNAMTRIDTLTEKMLLEVENTHFDPGTAIGRLAILRTYADEIMKPARDVLALGNAFADEVIGLDPGVLTILHRTNTEDYAEHCCSLILATTRRLRHTAEVIRDYGRAMREIAGLSEILDDPVGDVAVGVRSMSDGIALISEWERRMPSPGGQTE